MAAKFQVVRHSRLRKSDDTYVDAYEIHARPDNATVARSVAHELATQNPGQAFTIIQIIGHAVADLVRDLEP